ncbi:MAG TPA: hypothetical protein VG944_08935 [Fimbriimonas sp.]|nr:hypothetical protein [Fimbriimonas sp.]
MAYSRRSGTGERGAHTHVIVTFDDTDVIEEWKKLPYQADQYVTRNR